MTPVFSETPGELLREFIEEVPASIAMLDREMRFLHASARWCSEFGLLQNQIAGRRWYDLIPNLPDRWRELHLRCLEGETLAAEKEDFIWKDGSRRQIRYEIRPWGPVSQRSGSVIRVETLTADRTATPRSLPDITVFNELVGLLWQAPGMQEGLELLRIPP
jgi:PAS domain S-box-containing protein